MSEARARTQSSNVHAVTILMIFIATAVILHAMGRVPMCTCGYIKLWHGVVHSSENSQHLTDWYTFSHILHGLLFYLAAWFIRPNWSFGARLVAATFVEAGWEILENSPLIIERYRAATISLDYYGDSIVNSLADIAAMIAGFFLASRLPVAASVALFFGIEIWLALEIRDNLTLNVLMLIQPIDAIRAWQDAGGA